MAAILRKIKSVNLKEKTLLSFSTNIHEAKIASYILRKRQGFIKKKQ